MQLIMLEQGEVCILSFLNVFNKMQHEHDVLTAEGYELYDLTYDTNLIPSSKHRFSELLVIMSRNFPGQVLQQA